MIEKKKKKTPSLADDRIVEYGFTRSHFDERSRFQHIQILETPDHGRMLVLDGLVNLAEGDTEAYTHAIMGLPEVSEGRREDLHLVE